MSNDNVIELKKPDTFVLKLRLTHKHRFDILTPVISNFLSRHQQIMIRNCAFFYRTGFIRGHLNYILNITIS
jgi:hypothetical protein